MCPEEVLYLFEAIRNPNGRHFDFFSRIATCEVSRCPLRGVLKKCCCFPEPFEIQHGRHNLSETFLTSYPKLLIDTYRYINVPLVV
jgi:hypothetical protein